MSTSIHIVNPYVMATAAATTTKVKVRLAEFDSDDDCACSLTSTYEIWENDSGDSSYPGADLTLSVDDWISGVAEDSETKCAQVTALNQTGTAVGSTVEEYANCGACNDGESLCTEGGGGPGGP